MAVVSNHLYDLLKSLGMPDNCKEFTLTAKLDDAVVAAAVYYPSLDLDEDGKLVEAVKRYRLVEIEADD